MFTTPKFRRLITKSELQEFSTNYCKASGLPIPDTFLQNPETYVFGIFKSKILIGGFILGNGIKFRTLQFFASEAKLPEVEQELGNLEEYTEICCFYIDRNFRAKTRDNFFVWLAMAYSLKRYGKNYFLFGTCSRSLARLYAQTPKSILFHQDVVNGKETFIFKANRNKCVTGMLEIIAYKFRRTLKLKKMEKIHSRVASVNPRTRKMQ